MKHRLLFEVRAETMAVHRGTLHVDGAGASGFTVRHADGTPYGASPSFAATDVARRVAGMLEHMGFKPSRARALVDVAMQRVPPDEVAVVLRAALSAS